MKHYMKMIVVTSDLDITIETETANGWELMGLPKAAAWIESPNGTSKDMKRVTVSHWLLIFVKVT